MPVLAYCLTETEPESSVIEVPAFGVQGASIQALTDSGLRCFVSRYDLGPSAHEQSPRETALAFNSVLRQIFRQVAVIPFRFPTIVADENEISAFLRQHAPEYRDTLFRLRKAVQMELHLSSTEVKQPDDAFPQSGTVYLREQQARHRKLAAAAAEFHRAGVDWIESWRDRPVANGIRCYALIGRDSMDRFLERLASVHVPTYISARVSGPWPPTEFLKEN
jgi:hypothetical protein